MRGICFLLLATALVMCGSLVMGQELSTTLQNTDFEAPSIMAGAEAGTNPENWFYFSSTDTQEGGVTDQKKRTGLQSNAFKCQKMRDAYSGIAQKFSVRPGYRYEFSVYAVNDASDPIVGEAYGQVSLEWQDATGKELERSYGPTWNFDLSPIRWEKFTVGANAPEGAAIGVAVITFFCRDAEGFGKCYVDDVRLSSKISHD